MKDIMFELPQGMHGCFAIVKLWPEIKAAEDENIARFKNTARNLGIRCIEITSEGEIIGSDGITINSRNCDFVIHLHFETPKIYDVFSFVALWNPVKFYHDWGYERFSQNLLTHDDFLSCDSPAADNHVIRMIQGDIFHLAPKFKLHHTLSEPVHIPKKGSLMLFYAGINWERLGKGCSRHQELLNLLDTSGRLRIYGPKLFQDVDVWEGYRSYQREIPFDGISMINEISDCGAALVLSSEAHKASALMSNRLFESLAAGALIICDENPFARKFFGDTLLYINSKDPIDVQFNEINKHLKWADEFPDLARDLSLRSQAIFLEKFRLDKELLNIYEGLASRKQELVKHRQINARIDPNIKVFVLVGKFNKQHVDSTVASLDAQSYRKFNVSFIVDKDMSKFSLEYLDEALSSSTFFYNTISLPGDKSISIDGRFNVEIGDVIVDALAELKDEEAFLMIAPNESIMSNHLQFLADCYSNDPGSKVYYTGCLLCHSSDGVKFFYDLHKSIDSNDYVPNKPNGFARFLINRSRLDKDIASLLPVLNKLVMFAFIGNLDAPISIVPATCTINIQNEFISDMMPLIYELSALKDFFNRLDLKKPVGKTANSIWSLPTETDGSEKLDDNQRLIMSLYLSIIGRNPSQDEVKFYLPRLEKYGRVRILRDILLSRETCKIVGFPKALTWAIRFFWRT